MLKNIRQLHLYLGTFFAPLIIFFALTGAAQTFGWHENKGGATHPAWIAKLAEVHIHQMVGERRRPAGGPPDEKSSAPAAAQNRPLNGGEAGEKREAGPRPSLAFKWLLLLMSLGLITTTILGIVMAFKYNRDRRLVWGMLIAGTILPIVLLFV